MSIFKGQSLLDIVLDTGIPVSGTDRLSIIYIKPSGYKGEWLGVPEGTTFIKYVVVGSELDEIGTWKLQSMVVNSSGVGFGNPTNMVVVPTLLG